MTFQPGVVAGCEVYTEDGHRLGEVKEVRGNFAKIDARLQPDYRLHTDLATTRTTQHAAVITEAVVVGLSASANAKAGRGVPGFRPVRVRSRQ